MFGLLALLAVAAAIAWAICAASRRELYRGPASAIYNNMPHYSATTRTIFVVLHREVPELQSASLVAELPLAKCNELATAIMKNSPSALASAIRAVNANYEPGVNGLQREIEEFGKCFGTADFKEGTSAFMEKRKANFTGA